LKLKDPTSIEAPQASFHHLGGMKEVMKEDIKGIRVMKEEET